MLREIPFGNLMVDGQEQMTKDAVMKPCSRDAS
jgi:hypothetical protein